ncbi:MAG: VWA domain-containing protein [Planctomycetota bacterium]
MMYVRATMALEPRASGMSLRARLLGRRRFQFVVRCNVAGRQRATIVQGRVVFGSGPKCGVRLDHPSCALQHASLERIDDRLLLLALSERPVLVDGVAVQAAHLSGTESVLLGDVLLQVRRDASLGPYMLVLRDFVRRQLPALTVSIIVHALLLFLLAHLTWRTERPAPFAPYASITLARRTEPPVDPLAGGGEGLERDDAPAARLELDGTIGAPEPLQAETPAAKAPEPAVSEPVSGHGGGSLRALSGGVGGAGGSAETGRGGSIGLGGGFGGGSGGFGKRVAELREHGLDLAIVFDSTTSMSGVLAQVKQDLAQMVNVIALVAPDFRIALVTYKGMPEYGPVTRHVDFTDDRYEMLSFLDTLQTDGGAPDARSAMKSGLDVAVHALAWRKQAGHVLVVLGDAPPLRGERRKLAAIAAAFAGRLSTVYKMSGGAASDELGRETTDVMQDLARGKGEFMNYDGDGLVVRRLVSAALGSAYAAEVAHVFDMQRGQTERNIVERKIGTRDYDWLFGQFARRRVHPAVVDGLVGLSSAYVAERVRFLLANEAQKLPFLRARCLYVLRRLTNRWDLDYDGAAPDELRADALFRIDEAIRAAFGS